MNQTAAIAQIALRNALRSRVILVLLVLLLAAAFLFPLVLRSDGTPAGLIHLHLTYTLGMASFLLTLATLWAGCAAVSQEADDKTLQLLLVKPVPRLRIWLGKWLALLVVNAAGLALVGIIAAVSLQAKLNRRGFDPADLARARQTRLAALETFRSPLPDIEADVRAEYAKLREAGRLADAPETAMLAAIRRHLLARRYAVAPGTSRTWTFEFPALPDAGDRASPPLLIRFTCDSSVPGSAEIEASIRLQTGNRAFTAEQVFIPGTPQTLILDDIPPGATRADVRFHNHGAHDATLFFDPESGLVLRRARGTFAGNYLRALAALYVRLALFAALGVTLGTLFSMPVAAFLSLVLMIILQLSSFVSAAAQVDRAAFVAHVAPFGAGGHTHGDAPEAQPSLAARAAATALFYTYRATWLTLRPLLDDRTLDDLSSGTRIPPRGLLHRILLQAVLLPLLLAGFSTLILKKREWALPAAS